MILETQSSVIVDKRLQMLSFRLTRIYQSLTKVQNLVFLALIGTMLLFWIISFAAIVVSRRMRNNFLLSPNRVIFSIPFSRPYRSNAFGPLCYFHYNSSKYPIFAPQQHFRTIGSFFRHWTSTFYASISQCRSDFKRRAFIWDKCSTCR